MEFEWHFLLKRLYPLMDEMTSVFYSIKYFTCGDIPNDHLLIWYVINHDCWQ